MATVIENTTNAKALARLQPLDPAVLRKLVPAAFSNEPHHDVSDRYGFIPTYRMIELLDDAGFVPVQANQYASRGENANERVGNAKHLIRFRRKGNIKNLTQVGDVVPQVLLVNSHNRSSRFKIMSGLFRLVCSNGLVVADGRQSVTVDTRHTKVHAEEIVAMAQQAIAKAARTSDIVGSMTQLMLNKRQQEQFATRALALRPQRAGMIMPEALLTARRDADKGDDLWRVYNRVQENLMRGGIEGVTAGGRVIHTQEIRAIGADLTINEGLWELASQVIAKAAGK